MKELKSVSKELQKDQITLSEVRVLFEAVNDKYTSSANRLSTTTKLIHSPIFENEIINLQ